MRRSSRPCADGVTHTASTGRRGFDSPGEQSERSHAAPMVACCEWCDCAETAQTPLAAGAIASAEAIDDQRFGVAAADALSASSHGGGAAFLQRMARHVQPARARCPDRMAARQWTTADIHARVREPALLPTAKHIVTGF
jgi:hypothetical protein